MKMKNIILSASAYSLLVPTVNAATQLQARDGLAAQNTVVQYQQIAQLQDQVQKQQRNRSVEMEMATMVAYSGDSLLNFLFS